MSKIGPKDTAPELFIRKLVFSMGYRYRLHRKDLPGTPDLVFPKYQKVIFVNGCFWHGHSRCKKSALPKQNKLFWKKKITMNIERDKRNIQLLTKEGWIPLVIWQCEIKKSTEEKLKNKIRKFLV